MLGGQKGRFNGEISRESMLNQKVLVAASPNGVECKEMEKSMGRVRANCAPIEIPLRILIVGEN